MTRWLCTFVVLSAVLVTAQANQAPPATGLIAGRVVDAAGAPVGFAVVQLRTMTGPPAAGAPAPVRAPATPRLVPVLADATGRFVFTSVAPGNYNVDATKPGWLPGALGRRRPGGNTTTIALGAAQSRNDLSITLWRAAVIGGRVTDDNGDPLVGVEVRAIRQVFVAGRRQSDTPIRLKTDDLGGYRFSNLQPGDYVVAVLASVLSEPPGFAGAIRAGSETPRTYLQTMTAVGTAPMVFDRATGVVGADRPLVRGLSNLPGVPVDDAPWPAYPTTFHPSTTALPSAAVVRAVSGEARTDVDVNVRLTPTFQVSGVLRDLDGAAAWNAVHLVPADSADTPLVDASTAVTDAKGAFTLYGVPPGQYIARVVRTPWPADPGSRLGIAGGTGQIPRVAHILGGPSSGPPTPPTEPLLHVSESVTVADRHVRGLELAMREGPRLRGRAEFQGTAKQPTPEQLRAIGVQIVTANGRVDNSSISGRFAADGQFVTPSLWPGRYLIRASSPPGWTFTRATYQGRDVSDSPLDVTADLDQIVITFTDQARTIKGTVQGDADLSIDGAVVLLFPVDRAGWTDYGLTSRRVTNVSVGASGEFSIPAPPDGEYFLVALPDEHTDGWQNPAMLARLSALADRIRISGDAVPAPSLRVRRIQ